MRRFLLICLAATLTLAFVACGDDDDDDDAGATSSTTSTTAEDTTSSTADDGTTTTAAVDVDVNIATSDVGEILVDAEGRTLYGFKNDSAGTPTCTGSCAETWPPATVDGSPQLAAQLSGVVTAFEVDGGSQLKAGSWPLYRYAADSAAGDTNGQGVGGVWFTVRPDGSLNEEG